MKPKGLIIAIASIFLLCVVASLAIRVAQSGSYRITITSLIIFGLAIGLAVELVRGSTGVRWIAIVFSGYAAVGIYLNSAKPLEVGMVTLGLAFASCGIGLLTPFAGRHFAKKNTAEQDSSSNGG
jgi:hypothetical protein